MNRLKQSIVVLTAAVGLVGGLAGAADQLVLGKVFLVKQPNPSPESRIVKVIGRELTSANTIVGNPATGGASATVIAHGATNYTDTFPMPAAGWLAKNAGYKYSDPNGIYGPVRAASIKKMPAGVFLVKVVILGALGTVDVAPPDPGSDGGLIFTIGGGDRYCSNFGGAAGGQVLNSDPGANKKKFKIRKPLAETSCLSSPSGAFL